MLIPNLTLLRMYNNSRSLIKTLNYSKCKTPPEKLPPIVTILDVLSAPIGKNVALLLKQNPNIKELRLYDKSTDVGMIAEDISHIDTNVKVMSYGGQTTLRSAIEGAGVVVALGGCKQHANETTRAMFDRNVHDVRNAVFHMTEFNPNAIFCIAKPPVEVFVPLISQEYKKAEVYNSKKIIGIISDMAMRANYFIGKTTGKDPTIILCPIVGGNGNKTTVAVISQTKPKVQIDTKNCSMLQECIACGEDDLLNLYEGCNTVCLAPAVGIARFINNVVKSIKGDKICIDCGFVRQSGRIEKFLPYMTTIIKLGENGVESCHMPKISEHEAVRLKKAADIIRENISLGENFGHLVSQDPAICTDIRGKYQVFGNEKSKKNSVEKPKTEVKPLPDMKIKNKQIEVTKDAKNVKS